MRAPRIDWSLDVRYREKTFSGKVTIQIEESPDPLVVDAARFEILSAQLDGRAATYEQDTKNGTLVFGGFPSGAHRLEIDYRGKVEANSLVGLYAAPAGSRYVLTTMMFPTGSRRLLPTFEHPSVKTVYRLELTIDSDVTAVFNTAPVADRTIADRRQLTFAATPPMSAYLLYLGIGPFDTLVTPGPPWSVTVAASPGRAAAGRFCADRAKELIAAYEEYYGVAYPLPKLDLVALENFWAGAQENWGAIAFRESLLLVDPTTTARERRLDLLVLAHEIAHQWFGNLVTPADWDDFWLNESFATFVGHLIADRQYPTEHVWNFFMTRYLGLSLEDDSWNATHPVKTPVASIDQLGEVVDDITYGKGASVLRMIESYVGEPAFRRGLSEYLGAHRFANARAEDLWSALAEVSHLPVSPVMTSWITRPGYPVVMAEWADGRLRLRQHRFRADGEPAPGEWPIPLRVRTSDGELTTLFEGPEVELPVASRERLRINPERKAFVRVHLDDRLYEEALREFSGRSPVDQWTLVDDTLAFVYAGIAPLERFLELVRTATSVRDELPVVGVAQSLAELNLAVHDRPEFRETMLAFYRSQLEAVGLERQAGEDESRRLVREALAQGLARIDPGFARLLAPRFSELDSVIPELRAVVPVALAVAEGEGAFDALVSRLRSTASDGDRGQLLRALAAFDQPALIRRSLDLVPGPGVTSAGAVELLFALAHNPVGGLPLFEYYQQRVTALSEMWAGTPLMGEILGTLIPAMGIDQEEAVSQYFHDHVPPGASTAVGRGLEKLTLMARLRRGGHTRRGA